MSIFGRLATVIKSNINDMIGKAEDPKKMLEQIINDLNEKMVQAKSEVASAIADEKRLRKQMEEAKQNSSVWEQKAQIAVQNNRDDLAMTALQRHEEFVQTAGDYEKQWEKQKQACDQLKQSLQQMQDRIQEAQRKKNLLIARQKRAEAQTTINKTMSSINDPGAFDSFARMEEKINQIEAKADAETELNKSLSGSNVEDEFKKLEANSNVQDKLAALKAKMNSGAIEAPK